MLPVAVRVVRTSFSASLAQRSLNVITAGDNYQTKGIPGRRPLSVNSGKIRERSPMESSSILNNPIDVHEGEVIEIGDDVIWIKKPNDQELSISWPGDALAEFRVGHKIRVATVTLDGRVTMVKATNLATGRFSVCTEEMVAQTSEADLPGIFKMGVFGLRAVNPLAFFSTLFPLVNMITGCFLAINLLRYIFVKNAFKGILIGVGVFLVWGYVFLIVFNDSGLSLLLLLIAPFPALVVGYGLVLRAVVREWNIAIAKVDAKLNGTTA